jgi:hypothetical protein
MSETSSSPYNLVARAGDSFERTLTWTEDNGTPISLVGASVEWSLSNGSVETKYEDSAEASITDDANGEVQLSLTPTQTRALYGTVWQYEVTITFASGTRTTILDGSLMVGAEVLP